MRSVDFKSWNQRWLPVLLAAALLSGLLLYAFGGGLAVTSDSFAYLAATRSLRNSEGLLNQYGTSYTLWPPLYPVLLAAGGPCVATWAAGLNAISLLAALLTWAWLSRQVLGVSYLVAAVALAVGVAVPWLVTAKFVWSEPVFICLYAAYAAGMYAYLRRPQWRWLLAASAVGFLLPLQRTSGLFLVMGSAMGLLLAYQELWRPRLGKWLLHVVSSSSGGVAWLLYARYTAPQSEYYRNQGWQGLRETLADYGYVFARWFLPVQESGWPKHWAFVLVFLALIIWLGCTAWRGGQVQRWLMITMACYLAGHICTTVMSRSFGNIYDAERYAATIYAPFILLIASAGRVWLMQRRWTLLVLGLWLLYPVARAVRVAHFCRQMPAGLLFSTSQAVEAR